MSAASTADPLAPLQERIAKLENQANILSDRGDLDGAVALFKEAESLCLELGNKDGLLRALFSQANILYSAETWTAPWCRTKKASASTASWGTSKVLGIRVFAV